MMSKINYDDALKLPIGTVLVDANPYAKKPEDKTYSIVTEEGINYFQYAWFQKKYDSDPASHGVGIKYPKYGNTEFFKLNIEPIICTKFHLIRLESRI